MKTRVFLLFAAVWLAGCADFNRGPASKVNLFATPPVFAAASSQGSLDRPSAEVIAEFERASLANRFKSELDAVVQVPAVEIAALSCLQSDLNRYDCRYSVRVQRHGEAEFADWQSRVKRFTKIGSEWIMITHEHLPLK